MFFNLTLNKNDNINIFLNDKIRKDNLELLNFDSCCLLVENDNSFYTFLYFGIEKLFGSIMISMDRIESSISARHDLSEVIAYHDITNCLINFVESKYFVKYHTTLLIDNFDRILLYDKKCYFQKMKNDDLFSNKINKAKRKNIYQKLISRRW